MPQSKTHESTVEVSALIEAQPTAPDAHSYHDLKEGAKMSPPGSGQYHDPKEGVEPKAPGSGVYCDERANALSCTPAAPATPQETAPEPSRRRRHAELEPIEADPEAVMVEDNEDV